MSDTERWYALLVHANPVPNPDVLPPTKEEAEAAGPARDTVVHRIDVDHPRLRSWWRWRSAVAGFAAAAVVLIAISGVLLMRSRGADDVDTTTSPVASTTTMTSATAELLPLLGPVEEATPPGRYRFIVPIGMQFEIEPADPIRTEPWIHGAGFWPYPQPDWSPPPSGTDDAESFGPPIVEVIGIRFLYIPQDDDLAPVPVTTVDDLTEYLTGHPALIDPTTPEPIAYDGHAGVRVEATLTADAYLFEHWDDPPDGSEFDGSRYRIDLVRVGNQLVAITTYLHPDAEQAVRAFADPLIDTITWPTQPNPG